MPPLNEILTFLAGVALRLVIPAALTLAAAALLRRLDARWQAQAGRAPLPPRTPCWEHHPCSPERAAACPAYGQTAVPCWQYFRDAQGNLKSQCLSCEVFRLAPAPVSA